MAKEQAEVLEEKLSVAIDLLRQLVAIELARAGLPKQAIAKQLRVAKATVVKMLMGVKVSG